MRSADGKTIRGTIYDRAYKEMAVSLPRVSVYARPREIANVAEAARMLSTILPIDSGSLVTTLRGEDLRIWLAKDLTDQQEQELKSAAIKGVYLHQEYSRYYPLQETAAQIVGFVQDDIGLAGAEYYYDHLVGQMLGRKSPSEIHPGTGMNMLLTLDLKVQGIVETLAKTLVVGRPGVRIGAYAIDSSSGAIVAAVQLPSFDPNRYRIYSQEILNNLLVEPMPLPPLFRAILLDGATIESQYEQRGRVQPWSVGARQQSLGTELRLWERLGLSRAPSLEFGNNEERQSQPNYLVVADGPQKNFSTVPESLSPLSLLAAFSTYTNSGKGVEPYVVEAVSDPDSVEDIQVLPAGDDRAESEVINRGVSREIARMIAREGVACEPGGTILHDTIRVAVGSGKGFAQMTNSLYLAIVPTERAELSVLLTIQGGRYTVEQKDAPAPVDPVKELAAVLPRIAVLQQVGKSIVDVAEPREGKSGNYPMQLDRVREVVRSSLNLGDAELVTPGQMPDLVGLSLRKSLRLLQHATCRLVIYGTGRVVEQKPAAGASLSGVDECIIRMQKQEDVSLEALEEKVAKER
ncbi:MAG: hypothetical protein ACK5PS_00870 [Desulfopila sp.]